MSARDRQAGSLHARRDTAVNFTSFTFFSESSNLLQTALQYCDLKESWSDAQFCKCIGKTFIQPREWEQWPFTCRLYFNLSLSMPLSASSEMGPEQSSQLPLSLIPSDCSDVVHSARPGKPRVEFYQTLSSSTDVRASRLQ